MEEVASSILVGSTKNLEFGKQKCRKTYKIFRLKLAKNFFYKNGRSREIFILTNGPFSFLITSLLHSHNKVANLLLVFHNKVANSQR